MVLKSYIKLLNEENLQNSNPCLLKNAVLLCCSHLLTMLQVFVVLITGDLREGLPKKGLGRQVFGSCVGEYYTLFTYDVESSDHSKV